MDSIQMPLTRDEREGAMKETFAKLTNPMQVFLLGVAMGGAMKQPDDGNPDEELDSA